MADENQENQDLSMEDILSSIKDILSEDAGKPTSTVAAPAEAVQTVEAQIGEAEFDLSASLQNTPRPEEISVEPEEPLEEIIDLSPQMRINDSVTSDAPEINLDEELDGLTPSLDGFNMEESLALPAEVNDNLPEVENEPVVPAVEDALNPADENRDLNLDSDPFDEASPEAELGSSVQPMDQLTPEPVVTPVEKEVIAEPEPIPAFKVAPESDPYELETPTSFDAVPETEFASVSDTVYSSEPETFVEPEVAVEEAEPFIEPVAEASLQAEPQIISAPAAEAAVDVSASIISNFAKMFSKVDTSGGEPAPAPQTPQKNATKITELGNGAKTIEDVVSGVIRDIIGVEVSSNWRQGADYDHFAREEIARQTNSWLEANLPALVEQIVKKEIERVMAKVGVDQ